MHHLISTSGCFFFFIKKGQIFFFALASRQLWSTSAIFCLVCCKPNSDHLQKKNNLWSYSKSILGKCFYDRLVILRGVLVPLLENIIRFCLQCGHCYHMWTHQPTITANPVRILLLNTSAVSITNYCPYHPHLHSLLPR